LIIIAELVVMPLALGAFGHEQQVNEVSDISKTEFSRIWPIKNAKSVFNSPVSIGARPVL
jgi:hypothetical protein